MTADGIAQLPPVGAIQVGEDLLPPVGKAAGFVVQAVLEKCIEALLAPAVFLSDLKKSFNEGLNVRIGEGCNVRKAGSPDEASAREPVPCQDLLNEREPPPPERHYIVVSVEANENAPGAWRSWRRIQGPCTFHRGHRALAHGHLRFAWLWFRWYDSGQP
ncbi:MAG: hypothetical protein NTU53_17945 [Planctomycetota bacterium]|nr:hypothetical protein [Planctomycetota bacterium]